MQYILSQEEYNELKSKADSALKMDEEKLQKLCTEVANTLAFDWGWNCESGPRPWGCILTAPSNIDWYCDQCPVRSICPNKDKEFSK